MNMKFNSDKFECMGYWSDPGEAPLHPDDQLIPVKSDLRNLGVQVSSNLSIFSLALIGVLTPTPVQTFRFTCLRGGGQKFLINFPALSDDSKHFFLT